jgi:hypothetical protein
MVGPKGRLSKCSRYCDLSYVFFIQELANVR